MEPIAEVVLMRKCRYCRCEISKTKDCDLGTVDGRLQHGGFCSAHCLHDHTKAKRKKQAERKARREQREARERIKTRSEHMREAQSAFNAWVRERDRGRPCISCGRVPDDSDLLTGSRVDAGHYRSVGACPELRFEPLNCHGQCVRCNRDLSGNAVDYRIGLVRRIGAPAVEWLEGEHEPKRYTVDDLKAIKAHYRKLNREMKREKGNEKND